MDQQYEKITALRRFVEVSVKGVPRDILDQKIIEALQDFLKVTLLWQVLLDDIPIMVAEPNYQIVTPQTTLPQRVMWASFQDPGQTAFRPLGIVTIDALDRENMGTDYSTHFVAGPGSTNWRTLTGGPRAITHEFDPGQVRLVPIPATESDQGLLRMQAAIYPDLNATQVPAWIVKRYYRAISERAKYLLFMMDGEIWSNEKSAGKAEDEYDIRLSQAQGDRVKSFGRANLTVEPRYPIGV